MGRQDQNDWDEFDWEQALREGDQFAARYFALLRRFCDLPGANELIARHMGPEFDEEMLALEFEQEEAELDWDGEDPPGPWDRGGDDDDPDEEENGSSEGGPFDENEALMYETDPLFGQLRQVALGWCNVYATMLPPERRDAGLRTLFYIGRALANLAYSIDETLYEQRAASVAFGKRSLKHVDLAIGEINGLIKDCPRIAHILKAIRTPLLKTADDLGDHIEQCRRNASSSEDE